MLSVFPELLFLAPFSALIIRIALGSVFMYCALRHTGNPDNVLRAVGVAEGVIAALLIAGAWTQPAAIVGMFTIGVWLWFPRFRSVPLSTAFLSLILALTLIITGAGPLAFDWPL